jgi:hypothetical protein
MAAIGIRRFQDVTFRGLASTGPWPMDRPADAGDREKSGFRMVDDVNNRYTSKANGGGWTLYSTPTTLGSDITSVSGFTPDATS